MSRIWRAFALHPHRVETFKLSKDGTALSTRIQAQFRDVSCDVEPGEFIIVPRGVEHCPLALTDEVHVVLLEPKTTVNTGSVRNERTVEQEQRI